MLFKFLKKIRQARSKRRAAQGPRRPTPFRPRLEALEDRLTPATTRIWSGGDPFSPNWSAHLNWENGRFFPLTPLGFNDSVLFPADASERTNFVDTLQVLEELRIEGGDYAILPGNNDQDFIIIQDDIISEAGANLIAAEIFYLAELDDDNNPISIDVQSGSLTLAGPLNDVQGSDLVKTGAGTLKLFQSILADDVLVAEGELSVISVGGRVIAPAIHIGPAARLRLFGNAPFSDQIPNSAEVHIGALGVLDLNNSTEAIGDLFLTGGIIRTETGTLVMTGPLLTFNSNVSARIEGRLDLGTATRTFTVANGAAADDLVVAARIQGTVGLVKEGLGLLTLSGTAANVYSGRTTVNAGSLNLAKPDFVQAVSGELVIGDGAGAFAAADRVFLLSDEQISQATPVRVNSSGLLNLNNHNETLGGLILAGGNVTTEGGLLTLLGNVTVESAATTAAINGRLSLRNVNNVSRVFTVANGSASTDLIVAAVIEDGGLTKAGPGTMELTATSPYTFDTVINEGRLEVNGSLTNSRVRLNTGGLLLGGGAVDGITATGGTIRPGDGIGTLTSTDSVTLQAGASFQPEVRPLPGDAHDRLRVQGTVNLGGAALGVQPLFIPDSLPVTPSLVIDDGDPGFTATAGFGFFSVGFQNDIRGAGVNDPGALTDQATWTFNNLTPGNYRVSATWTSTPTRTTNAQYTFFNGTTALASGRVNQQIEPADFTAFGASWDSFGVFQVTGNSLTVRLNRNDLGSVVADAILIEPHQFTIVDNDGTDAVVGTFAGLPEGAQFPVVAFGVVNGQARQQAQFYNISYRAGTGNDVGLAYVTTATAVEDLQITPSSINEGQKVKLTGKLTDPDADDFLTLTIDWGDGKTETHHPGTKEFQFGHRYTDNPAGQPHGAYTVHLTWFDQHGKGNSRDLAVTVHNVAPKLFLPARTDARFGGLLVTPGFFLDPGVHDRFTATVDYGDGTGAQPLKLNHGQLFLLHHRYERPGTYRVTVAVTDDDGESATATLLVRVDWVRPHAGAFLDSGARPIGWPPWTCCFLQNDSDVTLRSCCEGRYTALNERVRGRLAFKHSSPAKPSGLAPAGSRWPNEANGGGVVKSGKLGPIAELGALAISPECVPPNWATSLVRLF